MVKRLMAKTGQYQKDGETKNRYTEVGVIMSNQNGEYALLDPSVNLAGVLLQQQALAAETGGRSGDRVMVSIFENDRSGGGQQRQQRPAQSSYGSGGRPSDDMGDDIPFAFEARI
ncbi:hypothetical protein [Oceaniglobus trochenteri]|uniref:hypothetical protein n=1 Tax=Oceaniglobus trochenteri TaxID=2763260 RepID=UPI001CFFD830|nr:hypothetical protein [Oceaniglobus trochenteri]